MNPTILADVENVFLAEDGFFSESGTVETADGSTTSVTFSRSPMTDLALVEPGYADTQTFEVSKAKYQNPKPGDRITDSADIEWIVEPGARDNAGVWSIPVKSDRRLRA